MPTGMPTDTTKAPPAISTVRRENAADFSILVMFASTQPIISAARLTARRILTWVPQRHLRAGERLLDLGFGRLLLVVQERGRRHDPAVDAVAALRHLLFDVGGLQGVRLVRRAEAGERDDLCRRQRKKPA